MAWSLLNLKMAPTVTALLDEIEKKNATRDGFEPAMSREKAESIIHATLWCFSARAGSFASAYAYSNLETALDMQASEPEC